MTPKAFRGLFVCAVLGALLFRTVRLDLRPMHSDEANQAVKFGALLVRGEYRYDPRDHHGPSLYYLTLPVARALGARSLAAVSETTLRLVPALFGTGLLLLFLLFAGGLARETIAAAAVLAAVAPSLTYYSRFYIQETILVFFLAGLIAAGWRYLRMRSGWWAAAAGLAAGMMYATKETSVILFGALAAAALADRLLRPKTAAAAPWRAGTVLLHAAIFLAAAVVPAWLLFTSFLRNPAGLADSLAAFATYLYRAAGPGLHTQPWYHYIQTLVFAHFGRGPLWSEAFIAALAIAGSIFAFAPAPGKDGHPRLVRFIVFFTGITLAAYSLIPYKTPWNALPFTLGLVLLAGNGAGLLLRTGKSLVIKAIVLAVMAPGFLNLAFQDYRANFVDYANPTNPYVYAQTSPDLLKLVKAVEGVAAVAPDGQQMLIKVVAAADETWPLPWYLRRFERVGYWTDAAAAGDIRDAPVIIVSAGFAGAAARVLGDGYQSAFYGLRPEVVLSLFVRRDLWDAYLKSPRSSS
ncbi:MAG TPA: flippase activity-associated protein Agl23 [Burkholderiales bacterium]|nr:flippase activity-associated protein Agl23 [Burkholderiales bacterium]